MSSSCSLRLTRAARCVVVLAALAAGRSALAGPPYTTDDPEPVPLHGWELYLSSTRVVEASDRSGDAPHVEVNYGAAPGLQLHAMVPLAFARPAGGPTTFGLGDVEVGAKLRFVEETGRRPQVGVFPLVELPTGDAGRDLGAGHVRAFLPVWLQKGLGRWTTYGGGGYWLNPGAGNRDFWFAGWQAQYALTKAFAPGAELFWQSPSAPGRSDELHFNAGFVLDVGENHHVLFSAGRAVHGCDCAHAYFSYLLTLGPKG